MPKRYTDTEKWKKRWFRELSTAEKSAWFYITEQCDNVGVWDADFEVAEFIIGEEINWDDFVKKTNGNIEILECGKWFLIDYCMFQHTDISPDSKSKPVISYIKLLKKHNLYERVIKTFTKPFESPSKGLKEKEKEKERVKEEVKAKEEIKEYQPQVKMTEKQYGKLIDDYGQDIIDPAIEALSNYKCASGKKYKSDYHALLTWAIKEVAGKDKSIVRAEVAKRKADNEANKKVMEEIKQGKLEQRLSPAELHDMLKGITKKSDFIDRANDDNLERSPPW